MTLGAHAQRTKHLKRTPLAQIRKKTRKWMKHDSYTTFVCLLRKHCSAICTLTIFQGEPVCSQYNTFHILGFDRSRIMQDWPQAGCRHNLRQKRWSRNIQYGNDNRTFHEAQDCNICRTHRLCMLCLRGLDKIQKTIADRR